MGRPEAIERVVGVWSLETFELESEGRGYLPWGENLRGLLFYTNDGHVSVGINRNVGKPSFNLAGDSLFYAGTFRMEGSLIHHQILVATNPGRIDSEMLRTFELRDNTLVLSGQSETGKSFRLVWKRK